MTAAGSIATAGTRPKGATADGPVWTISGCIFVTPVVTKLLQHPAFCKKSCLINDKYYGHGYKKFGKANC